MIIANTNWSILLLSGYLPQSAYYAYLDRLVSSSFDLCKLFFNVIGSRFKQLVAISQALVVTIKFVTLAQGKAAPARLDVFNQF